MAAAQRALAAAVLQAFDEAIAVGSSDNIAACCPLLGPLGLAAAGTDRYLAFAQELLERGYVLYTN
jgi:hypothetical protein